MSHQETQLSGIGDRRSVGLAGSGTGRNQSPFRRSTEPCGKAKPSKIRDVDSA
jgi:hypothetical protein